MRAIQDPAMPPNTPLWWSCGICPIPPIAYFCSAPARRARLAEAARRFRAVLAATPVEIG